MSNNQLPGLISGHMANRLSEEARQRLLWRARKKADVILKRANASLHTRWTNSEAYTGMSFREYCATGQAAIELSEAKLSAARAELSDMVAEFQTVANSQTELWRTMQSEVAAAAKDLDLTGPQLNLLWAEIQLKVTEAADPQMRERSTTATGAHNRGKTPGSADNSKNRDPDDVPPPVLNSGKKRGRRPDAARRAAICSAMGKHGDEWRDHLGEIFAELDSGEVALEHFSCWRIEFGDGTSQKTSTWADLDLAEGKQRRKIIDALRKYPHSQINFAAD
jgi:hypothetical protein